MNKLNNPYSFFVFDKSEIFSDANDDYCTIYSKQDDNIIQEYCFSDGYTALYRKVGDDKLAILYVSEPSEDLTTISIYTPTTLYQGIQINDDFEHLVYMHRYDLVLSAIISNSTKGIPGCKNFSNYLSEKYMKNHLNYLVYNYQSVTTGENQSYLKEFKNNYIRYTMASKLIPAQYTIKSILGIVNNYIATGKINMDELLTEYIHLQNFQEICSETIQNLSSFVYTPSNTDLRKLCDFLNHKINNIENLINMYLSNELERDNEKK